MKRKLSVENTAKTPGLSRLQVLKQTEVGEGLTTVVHKKQKTPMTVLRVLGSDNTGECPPAGPTVHTLNAEADK